MQEPSKFIIVVPVSGYEQIVQFRAASGYWFWHGKILGHDYAIATSVSESWVDSFFEGKQSLRDRSLIIELQDG